MSKILPTTIIGITIFFLFFNLKASSFTDTTPDLTWQEMMDSTGYYHQNQDFGTALKWAKQTEAKAKATLGDMDTNYVMALNNIGIIYEDLGMADSSVFIFGQCLEKYRKIFTGDNKHIASSLNNLALAYKTLGKLEPAVTLLLESVEMIKRLYKQDNEDLVTSLQNLGTFYEGMGKFKEAENVYKEAFEMDMRLNKESNPSLVLSMKHLAGIYFLQDRFYEAEPLFIDALEMARRIFKTDNMYTSAILGSLGILYYMQGRYNEAEPVLKETLDMNKRLLGNKHVYVAAGLNNIASLFRDQGRYEEAGRYMEESLDIIKQVFRGNHPYIATSLNGLGMIYRDMGKISEAEPLLRESLEMSKRLYKGDHPDIASSLNNMALAYIDLKNLNEAEKYLFDALDMRKRLFKGDNLGIASNLSNIAGLYQKMGRYTDAEKYFKEGIEMTKRLFKGSHPQIAKYTMFLVRLYMEQKRYKDAFPIFNEALSMYQNVFLKNSSNLSESEKDNYWRTLKSYFLFYHSLVFESHLENPLVLTSDYDNILFYKSIITSSTNKMKETILKSSDSSLKSLFGKWNDMKRYISKNSKLTIKDLEKKHINLDSLEEVANEIEKTLSTKSNIFASQTKKKKYTWQAVQKTLSKNEAAIEIVRFNYFNGRKYTDSVVYAALIINGSGTGGQRLENKSDDFKSNVELILFENGNELEQLYVRNYKNCIRNRIPDIDSYNQFWANIAAKLKGVKRVYVSPDGVYNQLNLATLYNPKSKKYLFDDLDVQVVTSTRDIVENKEKKKLSSGKTAVLIGNPRFNLDKDEYKKVATSIDNKFKQDYKLSDESEITMRSGIHPLPGTGIEIEKISNMLSDKSWKVEKYTDNLAIEETVKKVNNPNILHIATHGKFLSDLENIISNTDLEIDKPKYSENPLLRSYLIFAGADSPDSLKSTDLDDGFLTAYEAQNLYLDKTELVVLSACETGLGEIKNGEGVYGLQRAFIQAGAKTLIMSLWSVSDEATQELMTSFYKKWLSGKTKRDAFKEAQLELKAKYPLPYFWGAFVMVGE